MTNKNSGKPKGALDQFLDIQHTPDERHNRYTPRSTPTNENLFGMGVCKFFCYLFEQNENRPTPMTDAEIARQVIENYPGTKTAEALRLGHRTTNYYRSLYNRGIFSPKKQPPTAISFRYGSDGRRVKRGVRGINKAKKGATYITSERRRKLVPNKTKPCDTP
jgi:hypothetical protein